MIAGTLQDGCSRSMPVGDLPCVVVGPHVAVTQILHRR